jgi:hypothetical protein
MCEVVVLDRQFEPIWRVGLPSARSPMGVLGRVHYGPTVWAPGWFMPPRAGTWVTIGDTGTQRWELAEAACDGDVTVR